MPMTTLPITDSKSLAASNMASRFAPALATTAVRVLRRLVAILTPTTGWHRLNERLLRDLGKSPTEAEIEGLRARFGQSEADTSEAVIQLRQQLQRGWNGGAP
jgi:hypothetical protein